VPTKVLAGVPASSICPARGCQALISCRKSRFTFLNSQTPASKLFSSPEHQATFVHPEYLESLCLFGRVAHAAITKLVPSSRPHFCLHCTQVLPIVFCLSPFRAVTPPSCDDPSQCRAFHIHHSVTISSGPNKQTRQDEDANELINRHLDCKR